MPATSSFCDREHRPSLHKTVTPQWYPPPLSPLISLASAWTTGSSRLAHPAARTAMTHSPPKLLTGCLCNIRCPNLGGVLISELIDSLYMSVEDLTGFDLFRAPIFSMPSPKLSSHHELLRPVRRAGSTWGGLLSSFSVQPPGCSLPSLGNSQRR